MDLAELHAIAEQERQARKPLRIRCCIAAGCLSANAQAVKQRLEEGVAGAGLQRAGRGRGVGCLRLCCQGPLVQVDPDGALYEQVTPDTAPSIVAALDASGAPDEASLPARGDPAQPFFARQLPIVLENSGSIDPERIESYIAAGGYQALHRCPARDDAGRGGRGDHPQRPARPRRRRLPDRA